MKTLFTTILIFLAFAGISQTTPTPVVSGNSLTYTWPDSLTRTTNGAYKLGPLVSKHYTWMLQYVGNKLAGRSLQDSVRYRVRYSNDGIFYQDYAGLAYKVRKAFADTVIMEDAVGTAAKYIEFLQEFYGTDTTKQIKMVWVLKYE